jgi:hypothetical protein
MKTRRWSVTGGGARLLLFALALFASAIAIAGCTSARNALGPPESPCFRALPAANAAVNGKGHFSGVRYLTAKDVLSIVKRAEHFAGRKVHLPEDIARDKSAVCVVAYSGHFTSQTVANGWSPSGKPGTLAVVVVSVPSISVLATVVTRRPPLKLTRFLPSFI